MLNSWLAKFAAYSRRTRISLVALTVSTAMAAGVFAQRQMAVPLPPAPPGLVALLYGDSDPRGKLLRPADFLLHKRGAAWDNASGCAMVFTPHYKEVGSYRLSATGTRYSQVRLCSAKAVSLQLNRNYIVAAVVRSAFPRDDAEINLRLGQQNASGELRPGIRELGVPAKTTGPDGWQRVEWEIAVRPDGIGTHASCDVRAFFRDQKNAGAISFEIADFVFIELPAKALQPYARGEGARFRGGPGGLPMRVENASVTDDAITVQTTGAEYVFNLATNEIDARQRIEMPRKLATWKVTPGLAKLAILSKSETEVILGNTNVTFGVQADSLLVIVPHEESTISLQNHLGGVWNRFEMGSLLCEDDFGGFTVNPDIPAGTGRAPRVTPQTGGLDFLDWKVMDTRSLSSVTPGWKMQWTISPGERLCTAVMPHRPFDWKNSFDTFWHLAYARGNSEGYANNKPAVTDWMLWDFTVRTWGMSFGPRYDVRDAASLQAHVNGIHAAGDRALPYTSAFFFENRDPAAYVGAVRRLKDDFKIDGVYSDGLPGVEWLVAYEQMRMLRELFPTGCIIIHDTFDQSGRVAPFSFIHTYADRTFLAEGTVHEETPVWPYQRYEVAQFRKANCFGDIQGDGWKGIGRTPNVDLINLVYNGRVIAQRDWFESTTLPAMRKLKKVWEEKGADPYFYDRYYLPAAHEITGQKVGRSGMPIMARVPGQGTSAIALESKSPGSTIYFSVDGSPPGPGSARYSTPIPVKERVHLQAVAIADGLEPSRVFSEVIDP